MKYEHTQTGYLMIVALIALVLLFGSILSTTDFEPIVFAIMLLSLLILISFIKLKVMIDENYLRIKFGYGIFRKSFPLNEVVSVRTVRNHWYYGWGIRSWLWPKMLIFNVSGLDAVEIRMENGKIYRIGTDEPKELEIALLQAIR